MTSVQNDAHISSKRLKVLLYVGYNYNITIKIIIKLSKPEFNFFISMRDVLVIIFYSLM